jgi:uncharacterized protein (UPF0248 family)
MQLLEDLLSRIRWDAEFGRGDFAIGYFDRIEGSEKTVPFAGVTLDRSRPGTFTFLDDDGVTRHVPLHRVGTVYKDGAVIWQRPRRQGG